MDASAASPHPATSSSSKPGPAEACPPWLPPELLWLILAALWEAPQTLEERRASLRSVVLVSRAWLGLMARTASHDVHIASRRNASAFVRLFLSGRPESESSELGGRTAEGPFTRERARFANEACRSITFYLDGRAPPPPPADLGAAGTAVPARPSSPSPAADARSAISLVLQTASEPTADPRSCRRLPNLRHVSFRYTDVGYGDVLRHLEREPFPRQVTHLAIRCAFIATPPTSRASLKNTLYEEWLRTRDGDRGFAPPHGSGVKLEPALNVNVRHLVLSGVPTAVAAAVLRVCPRLETLEISVPCMVCMGVLAPLPAALRTLVVRPPRGRAAQAQAKLGKDVDLDAAQVEHWVSCKGLDGGLFAGRGAGLRTLVVHLPPVHHPELVAALRLGCERVPAEFVYEWDGSAGSPPVQ